MVKFVKKEIITEITENQIGIAPIYLIEKQGVQNVEENLVHVIVLNLLMSVVKR